MVLCIIEGDYVQDMLLDYINEYSCGTAIEFWPNSYKIRKQFELPRSFVGKAVCSTDDEWNEELGRKIAYSRAKNKVYNSFYKRANSFVNTVDRVLNGMVTDLNSFGKNLDSQKESLEQHIDKLLQKDE